MPENYESGGQEFESLRARQKSNEYQNNMNARKRWHAEQNNLHDICMAERRMSKWASDDILARRQIRDPGDPSFARNSQIGPSTGIPI